MIMSTYLVREERADRNMRIDVPDNDRVVWSGIRRGYPETVTTDTC